jgi:hypothetical protein
MAIVEIPSAQIERAREALRQVREETGFGAGMDPLPYVRTVAERLGYPWGLNGKRSNVNDISRDILAYDVPGQQPILVDVLIDAGGQNGATFDIKNWPEPAGAIFIQVRPPSPFPPPGPEPLPTPTPAICKIPEGQIGQLLIELAALRLTVTSLNDRIDSFKPGETTTVWPDYVGRVPFLGDVVLRPKV